MVPTLEDEVRTIPEDGDGIYALIRATHNSVLSLDRKLGDFQRETAENFAAVDAKIVDLRSEMHQGFKGLRTEMHSEIEKIDALFDRIGGRLNRADNRLDRVEGQLDRIEGRLGRLDRLEDTSNNQSQQLAAISRHLGIVEK